MNSEEDGFVQDSPGRCITWEMGGSQFTMTLWMGYSQTPEIENGNHCELGTPHPCRMEAGAGAGSDHDGTRNMSRGVNLLYIYSGIK